MAAGRMGIACCTVFLYYWHGVLPAGRRAEQWRFCSFFRIK